MPIKQSWKELMSYCRAVPRERDSAQMRMRGQVLYNALQSVTPILAAHAMATQVRADTDDIDMLKALSPLVTAEAALAMARGDVNHVPPELQKNVIAIANSHTGKVIA